MTRRSQFALTLFAGLLVALGVGVLSAQGTSRPPAPCGAGGPGTVYDDPEVRVFTRELNDEVERTVACSHLNGHRTRLSQDVEDTAWQHVENVTAPGGFLGYSVLIGWKNASSGKACILRIKTGARRCTYGAHVWGLGATRAGSLAWLANDPVNDDGDGVCCSVYKRDAGSKDVVKLDTGSDIEKDSFAVGGTRIYWTKGGETKSATMP
jgi:hypothetical protein